MNCTPNPEQPGGGVFMKYALEFKLDRVDKYKKG